MSADASLLLRIVDDLGTRDKRFPDTTSGYQDVDILHLANVYEFTLRQTLA